MRYGMVYLYTSMIFIPTYVLYMFHVALITLAKSFIFLWKIFSMVKNNITHSFPEIHRLSIWHTLCIKALKLSTIQFAKTNKFVKTSLFVQFWWEYKFVGLNYEITFFHWYATFILKIHLFYMYFLSAYMWHQLSDFRHWYCKMVSFD